MSRKLDKPMTDSNFQQLTLLANSIAIFQMAIHMEKQGSRRRMDYADILKRLRRVEASIEGHLEERTTDASVAFYDRMGDAVQKFRDSFKDARPVGRDSKGRFTKL